MVSNETIKTGQGPTKLNVTPASQNIKVDEVKEFDVDHDAEDYQVTLNNSNCTFEKTGNKIKVTGKTVGETEITVKATKSGGTETVKKVKAIIEAKEETTLTVNPQTATVKVDAQVDSTVTTNASDFNASANNDNVEVVKGSGKITIKGKKQGSSIVTITAQKAGANQVTKTINVTIEAKEVVPTPTTLEVTPVSIQMKEGESKDIDIETNASTFTHSIDNPAQADLVKGENKVTVKAKKLGTATVTISAQNGSAAKVQKTVTLTIASKDSIVPPIDDEKEKEYMEKAAGVRYVPTLEDANAEFLEKVGEFTNTANLKLNQTVRVTCVERMNRAQYTKNYPFRNLIKDMASNKIGVVKFINDERAKSAIAFIRDLDREDYGSELTLLQKIRMMKSILDGHNLKI